MGDSADEAIPKPAVVRNQITDGAVVIGPVVQVGTFTGQIHHRDPGPVVDDDEPAVPDHA
jgi:hypothetical protein